MAFLFAYLVVDSNPLSVNPGAMAHGRIEVVDLACEVVLVALVEVWPHFVSPWVLAASVFVVGLVRVCGALAFMPHYHHRM